MAALIPSASATGSGTMTLAGPSTNSNQTITIPDATGTMMVSGNMPLVMAYAGAGTSIATNTYVKVLFDTESYDTNNNFASSRFTPTIAGFYQINSGIALTSTITGAAELGIYKNGSIFIYGQTVSYTSQYAYLVTGVMVYCNGSTDYIEAYLYQSSGLTQTTATGQASTYFQAVMVRTA
jgi:hypothetical protein